MGIQWTYGHKVNTVQEHQEEVAGWEFRKKQNGIGIKVRSAKGAALARAAFKALKSELLMRNLKIGWTR